MPRRLETDIRHGLVMSNPVQVSNAGRRHDPHIRLPAIYCLSAPLLDSGEPGLHLSQNRRAGLTWKARSHKVAVETPEGVDHWQVRRNPARKLRSPLPVGVKKRICWINAEVETPSCQIERGIVWRGELKIDELQSATRLKYPILSDAVVMAECVIRRLL